MPELLNSAGEVIPTNRCSCGRPKEARKTRCCNGCLVGKHSTACNIHCVTLGAPQVRASVLRAVEPKGNARHPKRYP